jgi:hypothetical protein
MTGHRQVARRPQLGAVMSANERDCQVSVSHYALVSGLRDAGLQPRSRTTQHEQPIPVTSNDGACHRRST